MKLLILVILFSSACFAANNNDKYKVSRAEIDQQFSDFDREIKEGKAVPVFRSGKIVGYTGRPKKRADKPSVLDNVQLVPSENSFISEY